MRKIRDQDLQPAFAAGRPLIFPRGCLWRFVLFHQGKRTSNYSGSFEIDYITIDEKPTMEMAFIGTPEWTVNFFSVDLGMDLPLQASLIHFHCASQIQCTANSTIKFPLNKGG